MQLTVELHSHFSVQHSTVFSPQDDFQKLVWLKIRSATTDSPDYWWVCRTGTSHQNFFFFLLTDINSLFILPEFESDFDSCNYLRYRELKKSPRLRSPVNTSETRLQLWLLMQFLPFFICISSISQAFTQVSILQALFYKPLCGVPAIPWRNTYNT